MRERIPTSYISKFAKKLSMKGLIKIEKKVQEIACRFHKLFFLIVQNCEKNKKSKVKRMYA